MAPETDLQPRNFYLLAFWRFVGQKDSNIEKERLGQSHIRVVYSPVQKTSQPLQRNNLAHMLASIPALLPLSSLLRMRLHHPPQIIHKFYNSVAMATIPVSVDIYNASSCPVTARISTKEDASRCALFLQRLLFNRLFFLHCSRGPTSPQAVVVGGASTPPPPAPSPPRVLWTGPCVQQVALGVGQTHRLALTARVASPGVYEVNSLCLKAAVSMPPPVFPRQISTGSDIDEAISGGGGEEVGGSTLPRTPVERLVLNNSPPFVRQLCDFSSLVVVIPAT